jgi:hypothetical protein
MASRWDVESRIVVFCCDLQEHSGAANNHDLTFLQGTGDNPDAVAGVRIEFADQDLELASLGRLEGRAVLVKDGAAVRAIFVVEKQAVEGRRQVIML